MRRAASWRRRRCGCGRCSCEADLRIPCQLLRSFPPFHHPLFGYRPSVCFPPFLAYKYPAVSRLQSVFRRNKATSSTKLVPLICRPGPPFLPVTGSSPVHFVVSSLSLPCLPLIPIFLPLLSVICIALCKEREEEVDLGRGHSHNKLRKLQGVKTQTFWTQSPWAASSPSYHYYYLRSLPVLSPTRGLVSIGVRSSRFILFPLPAVVESLSHLGSRFVSSPPKLLSRLSQALRHT